MSKRKLIHAHLTSKRILATEEVYCSVPSGAIFTHSVFQSFSLISSNTNVTKYFLPLQISNHFLPMTCYCNKLGGK